MDLKIDTERHANGAAVAKRLRKGAKGGIPWMLITDAEGKELVTSDGPKGNVGCPVSGDEIDWFIKMLQTGRRSLTEAELTKLRAALDTYGAQFR